MNSEEVSYLNIDEYLGKVKNRVALVGVELEGGWVELPHGVKELVHDGSVFNGRRPAGVTHMGELPIGPAMPAGIPELLRANHPPKVNSTCGMHVHMSFDTLWYYYLLMDARYQETILYYLTQWAKENKFKETHTIWPRLEGKSEFCQKKFWPDAQASTTRKGHDRHAHGHRYTVIHYCGRQKTIECRVLPMFSKVQTAISAVQRVIDITNASLYVLGRGKRKDKFQTKIELPGNMCYEETIIERV